VDAISDEAARVDYESRREYFDEVEGVNVELIELDDAGLAEQLLRQAQGSSEAEFGAMAKEYTRDASGVAATAHVNHRGEGAEIAVARLALNLRRAGGVGLAQGEAGHFYLVRAESVEFHDQPWNDERSALVRTAMAWEREQAHLRRLAEELSRKWETHIYPQRLEAVGR